MFLDPFYAIRCSKKLPLTSFWEKKYLNQPYLIDTWPDPAGIMGNFCSICYPGKSFSDAKRPSRRFSDTDVKGKSSFY